MIHRRMVVWSIPYRMVPSYSTIDRDLGTLNKRAHWYWLNQFHSVFGHALPIITLYWVLSTELASCNLLIVWSVPIVPRVAYCLLLSPEGDCILRRKLKQTLSDSTEAFVSAYAEGLNTLPAFRSILRQILWSSGHPCSWKRNTSRVQVSRRSHGAFQQRIGWARQLFEREIETFRFPLLLKLKHLV